MIELRRKLSCPKCRGYHWHDSVIGVDLESNTCRNCNWVWEISYDAPSKLYDQLIQAQLGRIREAIAQALYKVEKHQWSINQGKKDGDQIDRIKTDLRYALGILDTFMGG